MGNRATIVTRKRDLGVYVHWYGSPEYVEPIITYCGLQGYRSPEEDGYGWARLSQVFGNYIGGLLSIGVFAYDELPLAEDNGQYVIEDWRIVEHNGKAYEPLSDDFDMHEALRTVDLRMPTDEQLGGYLESVVIPIEEVRVGMRVWRRDFREKMGSFTVMGFGPASAGAELCGKPYLNFMEFRDMPYDWFPGNYILDDYVHVTDLGAPCGRPLVVC